MIAIHVHHVGKIVPCRNVAIFSSFLVTSERFPFVLFKTQRTSAVTFSELVLGFSARSCIEMV